MAAAAPPRPPRSGERRSGVVRRVGAAVGGRRIRRTSSPGPPPRRCRPASATHRASGAVEDALRFTAEPFRAGGLAYDAVSHRFLLGDRDGRKLRVAAEGLTQAVDLVRQQSAGFHEVRAVEIDARRGDLWVASADASGGAAALHKLQLVSGRPLHTYPVTGDGAVRLVDVAVSDGGTVVALDDGGRVYRLRPGTAAAETAATVKGGAATSLALDGAGDVAYVAHAGGIVRVDLASGAATALTAPANVVLTGIERLRVHRGGLAAIQARPDGTRQVLRYELAASGRAVRAVTTFDVTIPAEAGPVFTAVVGDDLAFVGTGTGGTTGAAAAEFAVRRVRLR